MLGSAIQKKVERYLDLSAIAKGLGVDEIYALLVDLGYSNFLVEIGGEVRVKGDKDGSGWRVAVEKPVKEDRAVERVTITKRHGSCYLWRLPKLPRD